MKAWTLIALAATAVAAWGQSDLSRTVLVINGEEVKADEYYRRMENLPDVGRLVDDGFAQAPPGFLTMQRLIDERLLMQLAKEKNCAPQPAEVKAEVDRRIEQNPKLLEQLAALGVGRIELEYQIGLEIAEFKLQTQGITITDQELTAFYKANPTMFTVPKRYKLSVIAVANEAGKAAADADLKAGMSFPDVARKHSVELSKAQGGSLGLIPEDALGEVAKKLVSAAKVGQVTEWIPSQERFVRFWLEAIEPSTVRPLDDRLKRDLRKRLMLDRGRVKNDIMAMMKQQRAKARVDVRQPQFVDSVKQYLQR